jgi:hypothetical protein
MPITVTERPDSRPSEEGERKSQERRYNVIGTDDQAEANAALAAAAPATLDGLARLGVRVEPRYVNEDDPDRSLWLGIAEYGVPSGQAVEPLEVGDVVVTGSTMAGTEHVTGSLACFAAYAPAGETAPAAHGVGDDGQGNVEGVDIFAPAVEFEVTKVFAAPASAPSPATLCALVAKVNDAPWSVTDSKTGRVWSFDADVVLYLGHREGRARVDGALELTYRFAARQNSADITVGAITIPYKGAWDYLWFRWEQKEDGTAKKLYARAIGAYIEMMYESVGFAALGI